jgi:hypothetical protein
MHSFLTDSRHSDLVWEKERGNRSFLIEKKKQDVIFTRSLLRAVTGVCRDETQVHNSHTINTAWSEDTSRGYTAPNF